MGWGDNTKSGNSTPRRQLSVPSLSLDRLRDFEEEEFGAADPSQAGTPGLLETGKQLRRTLSFKSIREADAKWIKNRVWRSQHSSSPRKRPQDLDQLVAYAVGV